MKKLILTGLLLCPAGTALAHKLPGDETPLLQLAHHVMSPHHLPLLVLAVVGGWMLARKLKPGRE